METKAKLEECFEILTAILRIRPRNYPAMLCRAHRLLESALGDFFDDPEDVAGLADEEKVYIGAEPPKPRFPAA